MALRWLAPLVSKVEIERKFLPTRPLLHALTRTTASPIHHSSTARAHPAAVHFIRDVYYDREDGRLAAQGLWVRRRSVVAGGSTVISSKSSPSCTSSWEAKVRVGGDFLASQFVEVEGAQAVEREMHRAPGGSHVTVDNIGAELGVMCDLTTRRLAGRLELCADDQKNDIDLALQNLTVAIDQVVETTGGDFAVALAVLERMSAGGGEGEGDNNLKNPTGMHTPDGFFHEIGELELMAEVRTEAAALDENQNESQAERRTQEHETRRKTIAAKRAAQLEAFMGAHPALFPMTPRPRGKLVAYFAWREERAKAVR
ncbi:hypothetical protein B0H16DRAFT_1634862 [Mycena metata]|uniref:CYTH domain-containing protein n=1 Tax=Mycena metata TaxID=1033252 RepID=A0AAD7GWJ5_9AGAR|nr:hypothetical protein B0H16DRAFT_1634862 [Mycena metata]